MHLLKVSVKSRIISLLTVEAKYNTVFIEYSAIFNTYRLQATHYMQLEDSISISTAASPLEC